MKKPNRKHGLREKEANETGNDRLNPAVVPVVPGVLTTGSTPADLNADFVSSSAPLAEKPPAPPSKSVASETDDEELQQEGEPGDERTEYFNPSSPLNEKPKKSAAVTSRSQPANRRNDNSSKKSDQNARRP